MSPGQSERHWMFPPTVVVDSKLQNVTLNLRRARLQLGNGGVLMEIWVNSRNARVNLASLWQQFLRTAPVGRVFSEKPGRKKRLSRNQRSIERERIIQDIPACIAEREQHSAGIEVFCDRCDCFLHQGCARCVIIWRWHIQKEVVWERRKKTRNV